MVAKCSHLTTHSMKINKTELGVEVNLTMTQSELTLKFVSQHYSFKTITTFSIYYLYYDQ